MKLIQKCLLAGLALIATNAYAFRYVLIDGSPDTYVVYHICSKDNSGSCEKFSGLLPIHVPRHRNEIVFVNGARKFDGGNLNVASTRFGRSDLNNPCHASRKHKRKNIAISFSDDTQEFSCERFN